MKLGRLAAYVKDHGIRESAYLTADRLLGRQGREISYEQWLVRTRPSSSDYRRMEKEHLPYAPVISVTASMDEKDRTAFFQSLEMQVYRSFRPLKNHAGSPYLLIVEGACSLRPDLLWECVRLLGGRQPGSVDLIYFDSDRIGEDGHKCEPSFRPEYDPDLLAQVNYMGNAVLVRTEAALEAGLPAGGEAAFHAFLKRVCLKKDSVQRPGDCASILHIPKVLYHTGSRPNLRQGARQEEAPAANHAAGHAARHAAEGTQELISVLIPNRDHAAELLRCIESLRGVNTWRNLEILILENHSEEADTFSLYERLQKEDERIRVLTWDRPFNYSAINNFGAEAAKGDYLLLLNNDTQILEPESIAYLHELAGRDEVGAAGALLLYPDGRVQHAGIILGHGGIAGHAFEKELPEDIPGSFPRLVFSHIHNVCAVTGACLMLRRSVWTEAGGMDESLEITFNDVDLCMRLRRRGLRVLMCPDACLAHYESSSRGSEDTPEKVARFHNEIRVFVRRWEEALERGDPFYNPSLTLTGRSYSVRDPVRESKKPYLKYLNL